MVVVLNFTKADGIAINAKESIAVVIDSDNNDSGRVFQVQTGASQDLMTLSEDSGTVFNEGGVDLDFRIESNGNSNMLFVDGGNDRVGIGVSPVEVLHVQGATSANGAARRNAIFQDTGSAGTGLGGGISFGGYYNGTSDFVYDFGTIQGIKENATANDYAGALRFSTRLNGYTPSERTRISSTGRLQHGSDATDGNYTHEQGVRIVTGEVGSHTLDAALSIQGSGGDLLRTKLDRAD